MWHLIIDDNDRDYCIENYELNLILSLTQDGGVWFDIDNLKQFITNSYEIPNYNNSENIPASYECFLNILAKDHQSIIFASQHHPKQWIHYYPELFI